MGGPSALPSSAEPSASASRVQWRRRWRWRLLVLEAMTRLTLIAALLRLLPFRRFSRVFMGRSVAITDCAPVSGPAAETAWRVGRAVAKASSKLPLPAVCLPQAVVAKAMLARRGHAATLHLSARLGAGSEPVAHAWLTCDGHAVIGGGLPEHQVELARFV